jgi:hypothetical protein
LVTEKVVSRTPGIAVALGHPHLERRGLLVPEQHRALVRVDGGGRGGEHLAEQGREVEGSLKPEAGLVERGLHAQAFLSGGPVLPASSARGYLDAARRSIDGFG